MGNQINDYDIINGYTHRVITANGTYILSRTGKSVLINKIHVLDPSDSGGTLKLTDGAGNTKLNSMILTSPGSQEIKLSKIQSADDTEGAYLDGAIVVVEGCTGTYCITVAFKEG